ncbi:MAG: hypothetical protein Q9M13_06655 [Mariprofundales bacterium]|nr:hypothetical protein [Mariprofundales bacterium]
MNMTAQKVVVAGLIRNPVQVKLLKILVFCFRRGDKILLPQHF